MPIDPWFLATQEARSVCRRILNEVADTTTDAVFQRFVARMKATHAWLDAAKDETSRRYSSVSEARASLPEDADAEPAYLLKSPCDPPSWTRSGRHG